MLDYVQANFPSVKLSYVSHKKVSNIDLQIVVPDGPKCFAWFTSYGKHNVCFIIDVWNDKLMDAKIMNCCFASELSYGTVFYGTRFMHNGANFFAMEDVFWYKGVKQTSINWGQKFALFTDAMKHDIRQVSYNSNFIVFGLPITNSNDTHVRCQQYNFNDVNVYYTPINNQSIKPILNNNNKKPIINPINKPIIKPFINKTKQFTVKPDLQNDVYHLYEDTRLVGVAGIPDYQTSVYMNKLFRNIKENTRLDLLEESDDETEFENECADKFVFMDKSIKMTFVFNHKFKKWCPVIST